MLRVSNVFLVADYGLLFYIVNVCDVIGYSSMVYMWYMLNHFYEIYGKIYGKIHGNHYNV
jgi:hypothetical protein